MTLNPNQQAISPNTVNTEALIRGWETLADSQSRHIVALDLWSESLVEDIEAIIDERDEVAATLRYADVLVMQAARLILRFLEEGVAPDDDELNIFLAGAGYSIDHDNFDLGTSSYPHTDVNEPGTTNHPDTDVEEDNLAELNETVDDEDVVTKGDSKVDHAPARTRGK
jgi:hypothetical protein